MPNYGLSHIIHPKQKVDVIKFTKFVTDTIRHGFAFFSQMDLEKFSCASVHAKEDIFLSPNSNICFWSIRIQLFPGYLVAAPKMHGLIAADQEAQICAPWIRGV